jgi:hypothetical protein
MPNPYLTHRVSNLTQQHEQTIQAMVNGAIAQGNYGRQSVGVWMQLVALMSQDERAAAGALVQTASQEAWDQSKVGLVTAIDATAAALGVTRADLLTQLGSLPATNFT